MGRITRCCGFPAYLGYQKRISQQTKLQIVSKVGIPGVDEPEAGVNASSSRYVLLRGNVLGVVNHQYSPTKQLQVSLYIVVRLGSVILYTGNGI